MSKLDPIQALFSSETACSAVAKREIRQRFGGINENFHHLMKKLMPSAKRLAIGKRLSRDSLRPLVRDLTQSLREKDNIVAVELICERPPPSTNESYLVEFVQIDARPTNLQVMDFVATRLRFTHKFIELIHQDTEFSVNAHVLARYMQRERKPVRSFYETILQPLHTSHALGMYTVAKDPSDIALPFSTGVLLGETYPVISADTGIRFLIDKDEAHRPERFDNPLINDKYRVGYEIKTFVDWDALQPDKVRVMNRLKAFEEKYPTEIEAIFKIMVFGSERGHLPMMKQCLREARDIIDSRDWETMLRYRRRA